MKEHDEDQSRIRDYLLGRLDDESEKQIEERIFTDPAFLDSVQMTEDELAEDYVFEVLPPEDKERFVSRMLSTPEQARRLATTKALKDYSDQTRQREKPAPVIPFFRRHEVIRGLAIAASVVIVGIVGVWLIQSNSLERTVASLTLNGVSTEMQSDFPIELASIRVRSGSPSIEEKQVVIPGGSNVLQIRLPLAMDSYRDYQVTLIKEPDSKLFTLSGLKPTDSGPGKSLIVRVPASALVPNEYRLLVSGTTDAGEVETLGSYIFRIVESSAR